MSAKHDAIITPAAEEGVDTPLTDEEFERGRSAILVRRARTATGLSQRAFAERFGIPVGSLRDWEQGRRMPEMAVQSYMRVICRVPEAVTSALRDTN